MFLKIKQDVTFFNLSIRKIISELTNVGLNTYILLTIESKQLKIFSCYPQILNG